MNWSNYFFKIAKTVSEKSKDNSTKVGCVITDEKNRIVSLGFNGFPRGVREDYSERWERPLKYKYIVHAELNAILNANKSLEGCSLYITHPICTECAKAIIQSGIKYVHILKSKDDDFLERWKDYLQISEIMFQESGVNIIFYEKE